MKRLLASAAVVLACSVNVAEAEPRCYDRDAFFDMAGEMFRFVRQCERRLWWTLREHPDWLIMSREEGDQICLIRMGKWRGAGFSHARRDQCANEMGEQS